MFALEGRSLDNLSWYIFGLINLVFKSSAHFKVPINYNDSHTQDNSTVLRTLFFQHDNNPVAG